MEDRLQNATDGPELTPAQTTERLAVLREEAAQYDVAAEFTDERPKGSGIFKTIRGVENIIIICGPMIAGIEGDDVRRFVSQKALQSMYDRANKLRTDDPEAYQQSLTDGDALVDERVGLARTVASKAMGQ